MTGLLSLSVRAGLSALALIATSCVDRARAPAGPGHEQDDGWPATVSTAIQSALGSAPGSDDASWRRDLYAFYSGAGFAPQWLDARGRPTADASEALGLLQDAAADGLDPQAYESAELIAQADRLADPASGGAEARAEFDRLLSGALLRYLRHLHTGRVDPRTIGFRLAVPPDEADDFVGLLRTALASHRVAALASDVAPPLVLYRNLRSALARYRRLASDEAGETLPVPDRSVHPGDPYPAVPALAARLVRLGDLAAETTGGVYAGAVVEGVKRFQRRHGLNDDGVIGRQTFTALNVPLAWRVRQIELALERLRWLPHLGEERFVAVNIPMFRLWVWDTIRQTGEPRFDMAVIVGRALNTETPVFVERMDSIVFRPYWNVPTSILLGEILPAIARDPDYLSTHAMEIVRGPSDRSPVVPATAEALAALRSGTLRLRQRPGPGNALGLVKFVFPNNESVYMHDTPATALFAYSRRDFSHGCIRVQDPVRLAEWALGAESGWTRDRILAAMQGSRTFSVRLSRPVQVVLHYVTAAVMPADGTLHFADDIYGHDARLDRALRGR